MSPICKYFIPTFDFEPIGLPDRDRKAFLGILAVAKLLATNVKLTATAFAQRRFSQFDPIVHENSCQIRAYGVITLSQSGPVSEELLKLREAAIGAEKVLQTLQNKPVYPSEKISFEQIIADLHLSLEASPEVIYLLQTHFLTVAKVFRMNGDGSETAYIDFSTLRSRVSKQVDVERLKEIVDYTQVKLAEASIRFIQAEASCLDEFTQAQLADEQVATVLPPGPKALQRRCSCAFYNFKTILLRARETKVLILVKKYAIGQEKPCGIFYTASETAALFVPLPLEEMVKFDPKTPVFVIEGFMPKEMDQDGLQKHVEALSLLDMALINVARVPQFSSRDFDPGTFDPKACQEIETYRKRAHELGCSLEKPKMFSIVHTHAGSVEEALTELS
jgi:hypothetical protein